MQVLLFQKGYLFILAYCYYTGTKVFPFNMQIQSAVRKKQMLPVYPEQQRLFNLK